MEKKAPEETGELCPNCNSPLVIKQSRYGKFTACSNYPDCKYIKNEKEEKTETIIMSCPKCDFASWDKPIEEHCPSCNGILIEKKDKVKCMNCEFER